MIVRIVYFTIITSISHKKTLKNMGYFLPDCLEQVVERDAKCYLPWGLGLATGTQYTLLTISGFVLKKKP